MPLTVAESSSSSSSALIASPTSIPCRRFEYVHVLLLVEQFRPISSLPTNTRVIAQTEQSIDLTLSSDDDHFLTTADYSALPKHIAAARWPSPAEEKNASVPHAEQLHVARQSLLTSILSMLSLIHKHYGAKSSIDYHGTTHAGQTLYPVSLETLRAVQNPVNAKGDSTYALLHHLVKRQLSTQGKTQEACNKVAFVQSRRDVSAIRLDYLSLNEVTVPRELFELGEKEGIREVNLSFNHFLYFPPNFCQAFTHLTHVALAGNRELFHVPAEIARLQRLQTLDLTDCTNLISLPLTLPNLKNLRELRLFGCVNLAFPPHAVVVRAQIATQEGQSEAGVQGVLQYIRDPLSWLSFNLNEAKKAWKSRAKKDEVYNTLRLTVPSFRKAYAGNYVEYEIRMESHEVEWTVWRRFSQFRSFCEELEKNMGEKEWAKLAKLPGRTWALHEEDVECCEERRKAMDALCEGLRQFEENNAKQRHAQAKAGAAGKGAKKVKGLNEMPFVRTFFEVDANVDNI